jgi:hypothetical protein
MAAHHTTSAPPTVILAFAIACAACQKESRTDAAAGPTLVTATATDYAFEAPDTIAAGWSKFRLVNKGEQLHMALLIKLEGSKTLKDFLKVYGESFRTVRRSPRLEWAKRRRGPGAAEPQGQSNATQYLEPGNYAWILHHERPRWHTARRQGGYGEALHGARPDDAADCTKRKCRYPDGGLRFQD